MQIAKFQIIFLLLQSCEAQFYEVVYEHSAQTENYPKVHRNQYQAYNGRSGYRRHISKSDETGNCGKCSCKACGSKPKVCCKKICNRCREVQPQPALPQQAPSSLVIVPYPVPFLFYTISTTQTNRAETEQQTSSSRTTTAQVTNLPETSMIPDGNGIPITSQSSTIESTFSTKAFGYSNQNLNLPSNPPYRCPRLTHHCLRNTMNSKYQNLKSKLSETDGKIKRKLQIINNIRPTVDTRHINSRAMSLREMPKYGLVQLRGDYDHIIN